MKSRITFRRARILRRRYQRVRKIKARVIALDNKHKVDEGNIGRPVLVQRSAEGTPDKTSGTDDSDRPTLHRK